MTGKVYLLLWLHYRKNHLLKRQSGMSKGRGVLRKNAFGKRVERAEMNQ